MTKISIVVPVRNMQDYLRESLDSAVGQTLKDIEVICVDDQSSDASASILREYAKRDPRVKVITYPEHRSASRARKDGVLAASGEYILFLDADDSLEPDACERLYRSVQADPVDILHFDMDIANEGGLPQATVDWLQAFVKPYDGSLSAGAILEGAFSESRLFSFSLPGKLFSAELCKKGFSRVEDVSFPIAEDKYAFFILSFHAQTYRGVPGDAFYHYHLGRGGTSQSFITLSQFEDYCSMGRVADAIQAFLAEENALDRYETVYRNARKELLMDCVDNWGRRLSSNDRIPGFNLMLEYWQRGEVVATIAEVVAPKISIIMPVHNMQDYLHESLDSALAQTMPDIEIVCVDDHSSDASADILKEYSQRDPRVRVVTFPENRSVSQARKEGVLVSAGEYVMFLDADDAIEPDACERLYNSMQADPVDILHFGTLVTNESRLPEAQVNWVRNFVMPYDGTLEGSEILEGAFAEEHLYNFSLWDKIYSAKLAKKAFLRVWDGVFPRGEDKYAYLVLSYFAETYRGMPGEVLYHYHFGRGVTGHHLISLPQFERLCMMARAADAIKEFLITEDVLDLYEELYAGVRDQLLMDCVGNWNGHLGADDRAAGFDMMLEYWQAPEVIAKIAKLNWVEQGHVARLLKRSESVARKPRDVRVVGTYYHRYENGGAERNLSILIHLWRSLGYEVVLFTDDPPSPNDYELPEGVRRVILPSFFEVDPDNYHDRAIDLNNAIRHHGIDVMVYHAWVSPILLWDLLICKAAGVGFVAHCHSVFSFLTRSFSPYFADMPPIYQLSDSVVALSEVDRAYWNNFNSSVVPVVNPLTFDLDELALSPLANKNVLWIGRISVEKRPHDALKIFAKVLEDEPEAKLFMVGSCDDDKSMDDVYALISNLGIRDSVIMCGFHRDVLPFYQMCSVLLMTSEFEGFSLVLAESQSAGVPCVMYDLPYLTLTKPRKGFIGVELGDLNAAADAVVDLLGDPERRRALGREGRANMEEFARFDFAGAWQGIFDGLALPGSDPALDETTRIMWDTLMSHYRAGIMHRDAESHRRAMGLAAAKRTAKRQSKAQAKLRASWSFRLGYAITSIPRTVRKKLSRSGSSATSVAKP